MSLATRAAAILARIPPARTHDVAVRRDIEVAMPDGTCLLTDRYWPRGHGGEPVILMRSPYGRTSVWALAARLLAERGYQVILQSCRGTGGSGGEFDAYRNEAQDGLATLRLDRVPAVVLGEARAGRPESTWGSSSGRSRPSRRRRSVPWRCPSHQHGCAPSPIRAARSRWTARSPGWRCWRASGRVDAHGFANGWPREGGWRVA